ncbi:MAG: hypothetical protein ACE5F6_11085 [Anaerolineae bacterium]
MLDWRTGEEEWSSVRGQHEQRPQPPHGRRPIPRWVWLLFGVLLVGVGGAAVSLHWKARQQTTQLRQDIQATVDTESWSRETHNLRLYRSLLDPAAHAGWRQRQEQAFMASNGVAPARMTVADAMLFGADLAIVELEVEPAAGPPHRATRAYRRSGGLWLETSTPGGQVWLDQVTRETEHLRFVFHQRDAARIMAVMSDIQVLYAQLLSDLTLSPPQGKRTLYVILSVQPIESELYNDPTSYNLSDLGPDADAEAIKRRLGALLVDQVVSLFRTEQGDLPLLIQAVEEWEYADWLGVPLLEPQTASLQELLVSLPFLSLLDEAWKSLEYPAAQAIVGRALVDYTVRTYGRDSLADIVRGAQQYGARYPVITQILDVVQVLHVPFAEFDAGWRNYALHAFTQRAGTRLGSLSPVKADLLRLLADEQRAIERGDRDRYHSLFPDPSDPDWREQQNRLFDVYQQFRRSTNAPFSASLEDAVVRGDDAWVRVEVQFPDPGSTPYQQIRTYHRFGSEWKWASTPASFYGLTREQETSHLRLRFNRQDAEVVAQELPATEAFFVQVAGDLNESQPFVEIDVVPDYRVLDWRDQEAEVISQGTSTLTTTQLLLHLQMGPPRTVSQTPGAVATRPGDLLFTLALPPRLQILSPTLGALVTDMPPASFYRMSTGLALSRHLITAQAGTPETPFANALYEAVARWETEQWTTDAPWAQPRRQALSAMLQAGVQPSLRGRPTRTERNVDPTTGYLYDTVISYLVETYGRAHLGELVQGASQHQGWDSLIPDVLDVSFGEFEAGWREDDVIPNGAPAE